MNCFPAARLLFLLCKNNRHWRPSESRAKTYPIVLRYVAVLARPKVPPFIPSVLRNAIIIATEPGSIRALESNG